MNRSQASPIHLRRRSTRVFSVVLAAALLGTGAAGCGDDDPAAPAAAEERSGSSPAPGVESAGVALAEERTVIDVRTAEEFDAGHVDGAERMGLADADFSDRVADLDPDGAYVVYCRSGNRSAQAAAIMRSAGLDVVDGGALDDMVAAGWASA